LAFITFFRYTDQQTVIKPAQQSSRIHWLLYYMSQVFTRVCKADKVRPIIENVGQQFEVTNLNRVTDETSN